MHFVMLYYLPSICLLGVFNKISFCLLMCRCWSAFHFDCRSLVSFPQNLVEGWWAKVPEVLNKHQNLQVRTIGEKRKVSSTKEQPAKKHRVRFSLFSCLCLEMLF